MFSRIAAKAVSRSLSILSSILELLEVVISDDISSLESDLDYINYE
jgi:hypothetical protein